MLEEKYGKIGNPPPPIVGKIRSDYLLGQIIYFQHFQGQNIYFGKVPAPPPPHPSESNGRPPIVYAKCKYVTWGKKRGTRNTCNASRWPVPARL